MVNSTALEVLPFLGIMAVFLVVFHFVFDRLTPYDDRAIRKTKNRAARLTRLGAYVGYLVAIDGSFIENTEPFQTGLMTFMLDCLVALVVFSVAYFVTDITILRNVNNAEEIVKGNIAVAKVEFCAYLALGIIMDASFAGGGDKSVVSSLLSAALFSAAGLVTLMVVYTVYTVGWTLRGCGLDEQILKGNQAAAIEAGSLPLALGVALWFSIVGPFEGWMADLKSYAEAAALCIAVLMVVRTLTGLLVHNMGRTRKGVHHGNRRKAAIVGAMSILAGAGAGLFVFL